MALQSTVKVKWDALPSSYSQCLWPHAQVLGFGDPGLASPLNLGRGWGGERNVCSILCVCTHRMLIMAICCDQEGNLEEVYTFIVPFNPIMIKVSSLKPYFGTVLLLGDSSLIAYALRADLSSLRLYIYLMRVEGGGGEIYLF